jgi:polyferredoxin
MEATRKLTPHLNVGQEIIMKNGKWIRYGGTVAATIALVLFVNHRRVFLGSTVDESDVLMFLGLTVLPCFLTLLLLAYGRFWWSLVLV